jgi:hypothetical protein
VQVVEEDDQRLKDALKATREIAAQAASIKTAQELKNLIPKAYRTANSNNQ